MVTASAGTPAVAGVALSFADAATMAKEYAELAAEQSAAAAGYRARVDALGGVDDDGVRARSLTLAADAAASRARDYEALTQRLHAHAGRVAEHGNPGAPLSPTR